MTRQRVWKCHCEEPFLGDEAISGELVISFSTFLEKVEQKALTIEIFNEFRFLRHFFSELSAPGGSNSRKNPYGSLLINSKF